MYHVDIRILVVCLFVSFLYLVISEYAFLEAVSRPHSCFFFYIYMRTFVSRFGGFN